MINKDEVLEKFNVEFLKVLDDISELDKNENEIKEKRASLHNRLLMLTTEIKTLAKEPSPSIVRNNSKIVFKKDGDDFIMSFYQRDGSTVYNSSNKEQATRKCCVNDGNITRYEKIDGEWNVVREFDVNNVNCNI